ncbi:MAG: class I SAM-dependent methyltransferase [Prolixibacteraceae bacterium]|nr:class I SAM-dependent methyltransferase [Prolixibacteraceae bacterium]
MNNKQNDFYTSISKYYSEIFPYNPAQCQFVKNRAGELAGKTILDIGCATGELAFQLAESGAKVTGIDLNEDLLQQAKSKKAHKNCRFQAGNMLDLRTDFQPSQFELVLCFGNTLVHLQSKVLIQQMLRGVFAVLKPSGYFLLQILNYDYILTEQISKLPTIETENIQFVRKYKFEENSPLIRFQTELFLKKEGKTISNETILFALQSSELTEWLENVGFSKIQLYSNFKQEASGGKHLPLVVSALKY